MSPRPVVPAVVAALAGVALVTTGCESTQDKSARIAAELGPVQQEKGLKITRRSRDVRVVAATVLTDAAGSAVVVRVRNHSDRDLAEVPIAIDVRDKQGKSVYRNDIPGLEPALTAIPFLPAGGEVYWVNDQILATGRPDSVEVTVGAGGRAVAGEPPRVSATGPELEGDPYSGVVATGELENGSGRKLERVLIYAIARRGDRVLAAGRGALENLKPERKPLHYSVYFIGDPRGAAIELELFPTLPGGER